jgi:hypothetical protein
VEEGRTETIAKPNCILADTVEEVNIVGVTLLRATAENHKRVSVLSDSEDYKTFLGASMCALGQEAAGTGMRVDWSGKFPVSYRALLRRGNPCRSSSRWTWLSPIVVVGELSHTALDLLSSKI